MPQGPNYARENSGCCERKASGQLGHEESTPTDFLTQSGGTVLDYADGGDNQEIEPDAERSGQWTETEEPRKGIGSLGRV